MKKVWFSINLETNKKQKDNSSGESSVKEQSCIFLILDDDSERELNVDLAEEA